MNKSEKTDKKLNDKPYLFQQGDDPRRNLDGRPKGAENFATKWRKFIAKVAEADGMTPDEAEEELLAVAREKARKGDYHFYKDTWDRVYGKPIQPIESKIDFKIDDESRDKARKALGDI